MGESAKVKFCEECGNKSEISAQFCDSCGNRYPEISDAGFQQAKFESEMGSQPNSVLPGTNEENQPLKPPKYISKDEPSTLEDPTSRPSFVPPAQSPPQQQPSSQFGGYQQPPVYPPPASPDPYGTEVILRPWEGGNVINAASELYKNPIKNGPPLLEDQSAPSTLPFVFLTAILVGLSTYLSFKKTQ